MRTPHVVCLLGATATGKTDLAVELVQRLPFEIISVDSAMVYKTMDIGTAKPEADVLAQAPHRLIDIVDPAEAYSAARFCADALDEINDVLAHDKIPLLVGGTMLYFRSLLYGLAELPEADPALRERLSAEVEERGLAAMHAELAKIDPDAAERIHQNDPQRILRALEVYHLTGKPLTVWHQQNTVRLPFPSVTLGLQPEDRAQLHQRIEQRFHLMLEAGFISEVEALHKRGDLHENLPSIRCVGYRQVWQHLEGKLNHDEMVDKGIVATRQLAKRQITWMRSMPDMHRLDPFASNLLDQALNLVESDYISQ